VRGIARTFGVADPIDKDDDDVLGLVGVGELCQEDCQNCDVK